MKHVKLVVAFSVIFITLVSWTTWVELGNLEATNIVLTAITTIATVIMAVTIYQLDLTLQQLRFEALNKAYDFLSYNIKKDLHEILRWATERRKPEDVFSGESRDKNWEMVRFVSAAFNKIGYYVYKGFLDEKFIQEEFGGLVVKSFIAIRPYLEYMRNKSEPKDRPWFMRRFFLLIVVVCEEYLREREEFEKLLQRLVEEYGDENTRRDYLRGSLVPVEWLAEDVREWLDKRGYLKYITNPR